LGYFVPFFLGRENRFDELSHGSGSTHRAGYVVRRDSDFVARIGDGNAETDMTDGRQVREVIAEICGFIRLKPKAFEYFAHGV
jgi:hypothetical protein